MCSLPIQSSIVTWPFLCTYSNSSWKFIWCLLHSPGGYDGDGRLIPCFCKQLIPPESRVLSNSSTISSFEGGVLSSGLCSPVGCHVWNAAVWKVWPLVLSLSCWLEGNTQERSLALEHSGPMMLSSHKVATLLCSNGFKKKIHGSRNINQMNIHSEAA